MNFKKYKGKDKYHVRVHKPIKHPAIITGDDGEYLYGYDTTTSKKKINKHFGAYHKLHTSFSGKKANSFIHKKRMMDKRNRFSKPYPNSHLSKEDERYIDYLESRNKDK